MEHNPKLVSSEVAALWSAYMQNSMSYWIVRHFSEVNEDVENRKIIDSALAKCQLVMNEVTQIFEKENHAVPIGFTEGDINLKAGRIYSDLFALRYIKYMAAAGTAASSAFLEVLARSDVRELFSKISKLFMELYNDACDLLLKKGAFVRSPTIPPMEKVEYIENEAFLSGLLGKHRPLTAIELAHISKNCETNSIGRTFGPLSRKWTPKLRKILYFTLKE